MDVSNFVLKRRTSCNGCYFQKPHGVTCMRVENENLIDDLFMNLGRCFDGNSNYIYVLKNNFDDSMKNTRSKPKEIKSFIEEYT